MVALHTADMLPNCGAHEQPTGSPHTTRQRGGWLHRAIYVEPRLQRRGAASFGALSAGCHGSRAGAGQTRSAGHRAPSHKRHWPQGACSIKRGPAEARRGDVQKQQHCRIRLSPPISCTTAATLARSSTVAKSIPGNTKPSLNATCSRRCSADWASNAPLLPLSGRLPRPCCSGGSSTIGVIA
jgi:hypothetical protein